MKITKLLVGLAASMVMVSCGGTPSSSESSVPSSSSEKTESTAQSESTESVTSTSESTKTETTESKTSASESTKTESSSKDESSTEPVESSESETSSEASTSYDVPSFPTLTENSYGNLPEGFIFGMDASAVPSLEKAGVIYRDETGKPVDVFSILAKEGVTHVRVRVWNDPFNSEGKGYGGGNCDLANAIEIGKRVTKYGMKLHVDFHYSDFWADPAKQMVPKAWKNYTLDQKKTALYEFTKDSLNEMKKENIDVGMVQVGNETNNGKMCGETSWDNTVALMKEGSKAVRETYPSALVAVHFTNPEKKSGSISYPVAYASQLNQRGLDYDVFGTSYYPYWHGTLDNLKTVLSDVATRYNKKVMVMETSYAYTTEDTDYYDNTSPKGTDVQPHEISLQGQYDQIYDVVDAIAHDTTGGIGVSYWEGTWISVNGASWQENHEMWEEYGCGWASSYAGEYDPNDAGKWYGGNAVDNQAFFDKDGYVMPSIHVFNHDDSGEIPDPDPEQPEEKKELLTNGSFEGSTAPWAIKSLTEGIDSPSTFAVKSDAKVTGSSSCNLWNQAAIDFEVYQTLASMKAGEYDFSFQAMGECSSFEGYGFVEINGTRVTTVPFTLSGWENWAKFAGKVSLDSEAANVRVGVEFNFKSEGGWAYLDDVSLI